MGMSVHAGDTNVTTYFALRKTSDGTAATALTITGIDLQYVRSGAVPSAKVDATALASTGAAHGDNQAIEIDATDAPGLYRVDWPDAAFASGVREVILTVKEATVFTEHLRVEIDPPVNVEQWNATNVATPTVAGVPEVDLTHMEGGTQTVTDLKDFADAGYDPGTNKITGCVLTDTVTTLTGHTAQTGDSFARIGANGAGLTAVGLGDIAHGGTASTLTLERIIVASTTAGQPAMKLTGNTTGAGLEARGGVNGNGIDGIGGVTGGHGMDLTATTLGQGLTVTAVGANQDGAIFAGTGTGKDIAGTGAGNNVVTGFTADVTGNVSGSVGSVTGAVGSVTGAVGSVAGNVDGSTASVTGAVGSVTGACGSVTGAVGSVAGNVDGNVTGSVGSLGATAKTDVNAEVLDVVNTDTITLPGQVAPPLAPTHREAITWLYKMMRNRTRQSTTLFELYADNETTVDTKATCSDDGSIGIKQELVAGP